MERAVREADVTLGFVKTCPACRTVFEGAEVFCPNDGARLQLPSQVDTVRAAKGDDRVGTILDERYRLIRRIGEGGMGIVYEAEHVVIEKRVALKILRTDYSGKPEVVQRFRQEAKSASRIGNEHIVDISDFGETPEGASYFVMELLDGEDLANVLAREGTVPVHRAADIIMQCCRGLAAAHEKGIVHRDIKPENIFLVRSRNGRPDFVKLVDFGIAKMSDIELQGSPGRKLTKTGMIFGTPEYMSPEQAAGRELDHRVDVYALGVIFFEMLAGRVPFVGDTFMSILTQHMFEEPPRIHEINPTVQVMPTIEMFLDRALAKEPPARFQHCNEMLDALAAALRGEKSVGSTTFVGYAEPIAFRAKTLPNVLEIEPSLLEMPTDPATRGSKHLAIAGGMLGVLLLGAAGAWWMMGSSPQSDATLESQALHPLDSSPADETANPELVGEETALAETTQPAANAPPSGGEVERQSEPGGSVSVTVLTEPAGAIVMVEGRGEVCGSTPCPFETPRDESITVRVRRGRHQGEAELTPTDDLSVMVPMRRRTPNRPQASPSTHGGSTRTHSDLKIPSVFRREGH